MYSHLTTEELLRYIAGMGQIDPLTAELVSRMEDGIVDGGELARLERQIAETENEAAHFERGINRARGEAYKLADELREIAAKLGTDALDDIATKLEDL